MAWSPKDPDEVKDYALNWSALLGDDTIVTSVWTVASGVGLVTNSRPDTKTNTTTTVWISAGSENTTYRLVNRVTTNGGRTYERTAILKVRSL